MTAHELAEQLLKCEDLEVTASIDISTCDEDSGRRIFTDEFFGINSYLGDGYNSGCARITLLFGAEAVDNYNKKL